MFGRYGCHGSLIQYLQSRGRSRSALEGVRMIVILDEDDRAKAAEIESQEKYMTEAGAWGRRSDVCCSVH